MRRIGAEHIMWKLLLNASLFGIVATVLMTVGAFFLLLLSGEQCAGHGLCDLGIAVMLGVLLGPLVCLVCLPIAASLLAANPTWRTRTKAVILWSGVAFLVITGPIALLGRLGSAH